MFHFENTVKIVAFTFCQFTVNLNVLMYNLNHCHFNIIIKPFYKFNKLKISVLLVQCLFSELDVPAETAAGRSDIIKSQPDNTQSASTCRRCSDVTPDWLISGHFNERCGET